MRTFLIIIIFLLYNLNNNVQAQTKYKVLATKGLVVRSEPSLLSNAIGKLPFRSIVKVIERTDSTLVTLDNDEYIGGNWVEIEASSFYYINDRDKSTKIKGYVFDGFLEALDKGKLAMQTETISEQKFDKLEKMDCKKVFCGNAIYGLDKICPLLNNAKYHIYNDFGIIERFSNNYGQELICYQMDEDSSWRYDENDYYYYPNLNVLSMYLSNDHERYSVSTITGELVTFPGVTLPSPSGKFRFCDARDGQDRANVSFEMKDGEWYDYSTTFDFEVNNITEFYWINENEFICKVVPYNGEIKILKGKLSFWPNKKR